MQRNFIPGSEWLYFKLYTGHKSADTLLVEYIKPLVERFEAEELINNFFFIRYGDPLPHIRLRLKINRPENYTSILYLTNDVFTICINNGLLSNVMCDTYRREIERYGTYTIDTSEKLFSVDSQAIIRLLGILFRSINSEQDRWLLALRLLDDMLNVFGYKIEAKCSLLEIISDNFRAEFQCNKNPYSKQLNDKYRGLRSLIDQALSNFTLTEYTCILKQRYEELLPLSQYIRESIQNLDLNISLDNLIISYMHMTMNRLFRSKNRQYEMVLYYFMAKHYKSAIAKCTNLL